MNTPIDPRRGLRGLAALLTLAPLAFADNSANELVFDLAPFEPAGVGGEIFGIGTTVGEVVKARIDLTFVVTETDDWSMSIWFTDFPMPGAMGVSSEVEGWSGTGTFKKSYESDELNGLLTPPPGEPFYSWFMMWAGGSPFEVPGGGIGLGPMDGVFTELKLTLTLAACPGGDPILPWADQGGALTGSQGDALLTASGSLCPGEPGALLLTNAPPGTAAAMILGFAEGDLPFLGGTLVPLPQFVFSGLVTDGNGELAFPFVWPDDLPPGVNIWAQQWFVDPGGPFGFGASNGLRGCAPL